MRNVSYIYGREAHPNEKVVEIAVAEALLADIAKLEAVNSHANGSVVADTVRRVVRQFVTCLIPSCGADCDLAQQRTGGCWWAFCMKCGFTFVVPNKQLCAIIDEQERREVALRVELEKAKGTVP
jgi:hypothetical protein